MGKHIAEKYIHSMTPYCGGEGTLETHRWKDG